MKYEITYESWSRLVESWSRPVESWSRVKKVAGSILAVESWSRGVDFGGVVESWTRGVPNFAIGQNTFYVLSSDIEGIQTQGFLLYIIIFRLDALVIFKRAKSTLVELKNQQILLLIFCWFLSQQELILFL